MATNLCTTGFHPPYDYSGVIRTSTSTNMTAPPTQQPVTLTSLPPELWDHLTKHLPAASSLAALAQTNKSLNAFVEQEAWKSFSKTHFPSLCPQTAPNYRDAARTLTTLARAWDRRAVVARRTQPHGDITAFPGRRKVDRWERARGQTIGFTPQLDVYEHVGPTWRDRQETLAFSTGTEMCLRHTTRGHDGDVVRWTTYRPHSAAEGRDDVTALHLLRTHTSDVDDRQGIITGTANGDLQLLGIPLDDPNDQDVRVTYFATQGSAVRTTSLHQAPDQPTLLAANLGDTSIALYKVDPEQPKICPVTQFELRSELRRDGTPSPNHRAWCSTFLSQSSLAVGTGPSSHPIRIHAITESGLSQDPGRKITMQNEDEKLDSIKSSASIYTVTPLPTSAGRPGNGSVFLSGAYNGIVRLHDLRSGRDVEQMYTDPADDSAIYSILPRGRECFMTGTSRYNLLKVFDLRLGAKCYNYLDANPHVQGPDPVDPNCDYNIFLRQSNPAPIISRGSGWQRNRIVNSSVYSLASASADSPFVYAGVANAVISLAFTELLDPHPDSAFFQSWFAKGEGNGTISARSIPSQDVLSLAMYNQGASMKLCNQRSPWETWRANQPGPGRRMLRRRIDERWKGANEFGP